MIVLYANTGQYYELNGYQNNTSRLEFGLDAYNRWVVGLEVLNDANFAPIHDQLNELERIEYTPNEQL
jgi:hypothetical protein